MHSYELDAKYLMMDDKLELTGGAFVQHVYHNALALKSDALLKDVNVNEIVNNLASENVKTFLKNNADKVEAYKDALKKVKEEEAKLDKEEVIVEAKKDLKDAENDFNKKIDALRSVAFKNEKLKVTIAGILKDASSKGVAGLVEEILKEIKTKNQNGYAAKFKEIEPELKNDKNLTNSIKDLENAFNNIKAKREALETAYDEIEPEKLDSLTDAQEALYNAQIKLNPDVIDFLNNQEMVNQYTSLAKNVIDNTNLVSLPEHQFNYGVKLGAKYTGVENLTLKANGVFGASTHRGLLPMQNYTLGFVKLDAGAKYDYKVTDKFVVSPELNTTVKFSDITKDNFNSELVLAPKVSAKYTPIDKLDISGEVEVPIKWSGDKAKFGFDNATIKTGVNVKYT